MPHAAVGVFDSHPGYLYEVRVRDEMDVAGRLSGYAVEEKSFGGADDFEKSLLGFVVVGDIVFPRPLEVVAVASKTVVVVDVFHVAG